LRDGQRDSIFTELGIIERVEVINGPSSTEGIGASGGIINYVTKSPPENGGTEFGVSTQVRTQFEDDSESWRVALNVGHKNEFYDFLVAGSFAETGISYDGSGRTIGIDPSGSARDSESTNLFVKVGTDFGANDAQRVEVSFSDFVLECQCNYRINLQSPDFGFHFANQIPIEAIKESPPESRGSFNDFRQFTVSYVHGDLFGGALYLQYYDADQAMRFESERTFNKQEPEFLPFVLDANGFPLDDVPLAEQSEINSQKKGLRTSWSTETLASIDGLGLQVGIDFVEDTAQQRLAIQDRSWVPPMEYTSVAPFAQVSYDLGAWTFTGGLRNEDGEFKVDDYVTSWANDRRPVGGGKITYNELLPNIGAIWRFAEQWSTYASYSKGFSLPNAGIPLRNIRCSNDTSERGDPTDPINQPFGGIQPDGCPNDDPISVNDILDLGAIVVDNVELGISWTGEQASASAAVYESTSDFGSRLQPDPIVGDLVLARKPTEIQGIELSGSYNIPGDVTVTGIFSHITGDTSNDDPDNLDRELGVFDVPPDKLVLTADWQFSENGNVILGSLTVFDRDVNVGRAGEERINGYTVFDLSTNYEIGGGVVSLGIDNLFDKSYFGATAQVLFFQNYMRARGREVSLGYNIRY